MILSNDQRTLVPIPRNLVDERADFTFCPTKYDMNEPMKFCDFAMKNGLQDEMARLKPEIWWNMGTQLSDTGG